MKPIAARIKDHLAIAGMPVDDTPTRTYQRILIILGYELALYDEIWERRASARRYHAMYEGRKRLTEDIQIVESLYKQHAGLEDEIKPLPKMNRPDTPYGE